MEILNILEKIQNPESLNVSDEMAFKKLAINYPYFQAGQALHLKILKNEESFELKKYLRSAALHTANRSILFDFINRHIDEQEDAVLSIKQNAENLGLTEDEANKINDPNLFEEKKSIPKKHSFYEWLNLTKLKPLDETEIKAEPKEIDEQQLRKNELIDKFILNNPKIKPSSKTDFNRQKPLKTKPSQQLMTETLAKIYLDQKKYDKAIEAYNILILNNPKKSSFFASQIKIIKTLQENN